MLQVFQESGDWFIGLLAGVAEAVFELVVGIENLAFDVELYAANAALDQTPGHQAALAVGGCGGFVKAVGFASGF